MPATHDANLGRRPCCTTHIAATYVQLRGANVVARTVAPVAPEARAGIN
jgi:hypothetical protein